MVPHPIQEHIERYVRRDGTVVDMLAIAQHLDGCYDCRRIATGLEGEMSQSRMVREVGPKPTDAGAALWWTVALVFGTGVGAALLLTYK